MRMSAGLAFQPRPSEPGAGLYQAVPAGHDALRPRGVASHPPNPIPVVPIKGDSEHVPPDGKLRVTRSRTGGNNFEPLTNGLPQQHCYVNVLRVPMVGISAALRRRWPWTKWTTSASPSAPIFGAFDATGGQVYCSPEGGDHWSAINEHFPGVLSVEVKPFR